MRAMGIRRRREATDKELVALIHRETQVEAGAHRRTTEYLGAVDDTLRAIKRLGGRVVDVKVDLVEEDA
jgi:hypothetical protein